MATEQKTAVVARKPTKREKRLTVRVADWENMPGFGSNRTKMVSGFEHAHAYHCPGSQNGRK